MTSIGCSICLHSTTSNLGLLNSTTPNWSRSGPKTVVLGRSWAARDLQDANLLVHGHSRDCIMHNKLYIIRQLYTWHAYNLI